MSVGIGGLDKEFASMFRRAFASRVYDPKVVKALGIKHVRGTYSLGNSEPFEGLERDSFG